MLLILCVFLQLMQEPTNILNTRKIQCMTNIYLLHVSALCAIHRESFRSKNASPRSWSRYVYTYLVQCSNIQIPTRCTCYQVYFIWQLLHIFRASPSPIFRSTKQLWLQHLVTVTPYYCLLLSWKIAVTVWQIPDAVDTVVCAPVDGWKYHPKHVEQFPVKINCVTLHLVGYILE